MAKAKKDKEWGSVGEAIADLEAFYGLKSVSDPNYESPVRRKLYFVSPTGKNLISVTLLCFYDSITKKESWVWGSSNSCDTQPALDFKR